MRANRTYILVADGARARLMMAEGRGQPSLAEVPGAEFHQKVPSTHELGTDRPGRVHESADTARHAVQQTDWHRQEEERFARMLANMLEERFDRGEYRRLVLVAPPQMLGNLRAALADKLKAIVTGEVAKDLTKMPNHQLGEYIPEDALH